MATISELRDHVRTQMDVTSSELTDAEVNRYLEEAFNRTISAETEWPFYEKSWTVTQLASASTIDLPSDVAAAQVISLVHIADNRRLTQIAYNEAEDYYFGAHVGNTPYQFSIWNELIYLWPAATYSASVDYRLRGHRKPNAWDSSASSVPDCDERLHLPMAHYATALGFLQQEDRGMEQVYMERWLRDVDIVRMNLMEARSHRPLTMGPHVTTAIGGGPRRFQPSFRINI